MTLTFPAAYGKIPLISQPSPAERPDHEKNGESVMERIKTLETRNLCEKMCIRDRICTLKTEQCE